MPKIKFSFYYISASDPLKKFVDVDKLSEYILANPLDDDMRTILQVMTTEIIGA